MKKILLIILLIVVLVVIAVAMRKLTEPVIEEPEISLEEEVKINNNNLVFDKFGLSLSFPEGWEVEIKSEVKDIPISYGSFSFSFIPPEGIPSALRFWGALYLSVYESQPNIEEFIQQHYPDSEDEYNLVGKKREDIGGKSVFLVEPEDPADIFWLPRYVILGTDYSYTYGFSQDGADGFVQKIIEEIFPHFNIE